MPKSTFYRLDEAKRTRIESAAMTVINEKGYDRTTIRDIVRASKIPRGSFYQYFTGMHDLFQHLLFVVSEQKMMFLQPLWEKVSQKSFIELYPDIIKAGLAFAFTNKKAYVFGYHLYHSNSKEILGLRRTLETQGVAMMSDLLEADQDKGTLKQGIAVDLLAQMLYDFNARQLIYMVYEQESEDVIMEKAHAFLNIINDGIMNHNEEEANE